ncbi:MAG: DNA polymerase III subunit delta, partial [Bacteroidales bacterium]
EKTVFLLVSNEADAMLGTILSRTQTIHVRPVAEQILAQALQSRFGVNSQDSQRIAHLSNGNVVKALENLSVSEEREYLLELFKQMMRLAYGRKLKEMKKWSEEVAALGRERQKNFLCYAQQMIRENFIYNLHQPQLNYMNYDEEAFSSRFSPFVNTHNTPAIMETLDLAEQHIGQNVNAKMVFFDLALKFIMLLKTN